MKDGPFKRRKVLVNLGEQVGALRLRHRCNHAQNVLPAAQKLWIQREVLSQHLRGALGLFLEHAQALDENQRFGDEVFDRAFLVLIQRFQGIDRRF